MQHADGTVTQKLTSKRDVYNKHASTVSQDINFEPYENQSQSSHETFWTAAEEFLFGTKSSSDGDRKFKLGQENRQATLTNENGFIWTGEIYMGKLSKMDVIYDTGSDWIMIEAAECVNCEGNTYDIASSIETGKAQQT